jgi:hypothetical protein
MICESGLEMVGHSGVPLEESEHEGWVRRGLKGVYDFRFFHPKEDVCPSEHSIFAPLLELTCVLTFSFRCTQISIRVEIWLVHFLEWHFR